MWIFLVSGSSLLNVNSCLFAGFIPLKILMVCHTKQFDKWSKDLKVTLLIEQMP